MWSQPCVCYVSLVGYMSCYMNGMASVLSCSGNCIEFLPSRRWWSSHMKGGPLGQRQQLRNDTKALTLLLSCKLHTSVLYTSYLSALVHKVCSQWEVCENAVYYLHTWNRLKIQCATLDTSQWTPYWWCCNVMTKDHISICYLANILSSDGSTILMSH